MGHGASVAYCGIDWCALAGDSRAEKTRALADASARAGRRRVRGGYGPEVGWGGKVVSHPFAKCSEWMGHPGPFGGSNIRVEDQSLGGFSA